MKSHGCFVEAKLHFVSSTFMDKKKKVKEKEKISSKVKKACRHSFEPNFADTKQETEVYNLK